MNSGSPLEGGNMSSPILIDGVVHKPASKNSATLHRLLLHLRAKGIAWIPHSLGVSNQVHRLSYLAGEVPHEAADWLFSDAMLKDIASKLRILHDASVDFDCTGAQWGLPPRDPSEVICHNDFAYYNCVFQNHNFVGLIDFDVCAPGPRLWDLAYAAYRFVPFEQDYFKSKKISEIPEFLRKRVQQLLAGYNAGTPTLCFEAKPLVQMIRKRITALAQWTHHYALEANKPELRSHAAMYYKDATWIGRLEEEVFD